MCISSQHVRCHRTLMSSEAVHRSLSNLNRSDCALERWESHTHLCHSTSGSLWIFKLSWECWRSRSVVQDGGQDRQWGNLWGNGTIFPSCMRWFDDSTAHVFHKIYFKVSEVSHRLFWWSSSWPFAVVILISKAENRRL